MSDQFRIPFGRAVLDDGRAVDVVLPAAKLRLGAMHYNESLKGKLLCGGCAVDHAAKIHFNKGTQKILGGDLNGPSPHFVTNREQKHIKCSFKDGHTSRPTEYDTTKGYRIHLNIEPVADHFNARSHARRAPNGMIVHNNPEISAMEIVTVQSVKDLVKLMERADTQRLRQSVVIHHGYPPIPWNEFFIRYEHSTRRVTPLASSRFIKLTEKLLDRNGKAAHPVLMEMRFQRPVEPKAGYTTANGVSRTMYWGENDTTKQAVHIQPKLILTRLDRPEVANAVPDDGCYLVLGHVRIESKYTGNDITHSLNIRVRYPDRIVKKDLEDIVTSRQPSLFTASMPA